MSGVCGIAWHWPQVTPRAALPWPIVGCGGGASADKGVLNKFACILRVRERVQQNHLTMSAILVYQE